MSPVDALSRLADEAGILTSYEGVDGAEHPADPDTLLALLGVLGIPLSAPDGAMDALRQLRSARAYRSLEPVLVHWVGSPRPFTITLPTRVHPRDGWLTVELEDGSSHRERLTHAIARPLGGAAVDGRRLDRYELHLGATTEFRLPPGYHRVRLEAPEVEAEALLVTAPRLPRPERVWGAFMPLHAVRTDHDAGVGTYGDLARLRAVLGRHGAALLGTLPLYPAYLGGPVEVSPYLPVTKLGWNELYIDPMAVPELAESPEARQLLEAGFDQREAARRSVLVDQPGIMGRLRSVLELLADVVFDGDSARRRELESFVEQRPEVAAYAAFRAAGEAAGADWHGWGTSEPGVLPEGGVDERAERYHLYVQWLAEQQLAAASHDDHSDPGGLYLDLPVGVHPLGFDPWWWSSSFVRGASGGAPPDAFFPAGQDWAFPPLHPDAERQAGYPYLRATVRHACRHAAVLRVDHVMGLHRLYFVPDGADATAGAYVRYADEEQRAVVALEAARAGSAVVGEDLGTVPDQVRTAMAHDHMLRSWVYQFEGTAEDPLPRPPAHCLASIGTHDLPRFAAFWAGTDIDDAERAGQRDAEGAAEARVARADLRRALLAHVAPETPAGQTAGLHERAALQAVLTHLAASPADAVLVDLEDLWGERRPQNRPGTGAEANNWRRRSALTLEQLEADPAVTGLLEDVESLRRRPPPAEPVPAAPPAASDEPPPTAERPRFWRRR